MVYTCKRGSPTLKCNITVCGISSGCSLFAKVRVKESSESGLIL